MLSLCFSHVATGASPFCSNLFHFLAKLSKICSYTAVISSSYDKRFEIFPANYYYPGRDPETWFELSKFFELFEVELTKFHCMGV